GGYSLAQYQNLSADELLALILSKDFSFKPGTKFEYNNVSAFLLGLVIERILQLDLSDVAQQYFFKPLGMNRTSFYPEKFSDDEVAPTEISDKLNTTIHKLVHDESARVFKNSGIVTGHAGLFSTTPDLLKFAYMLLNKGSLDGHRYFSEQT